ncbi:hypothetical protein GCM10007897_10220 [Sphingobium jiangsuense]|uniref:Uncharacterized protein n=1 Tax=Sphingobium jiangsuense TaxID=870476 RepID=A0A7W6BI24_9SPHN|nr:DUF6489 family protein [Sphingobium jiangsuense]MBB3927318.1 hypothetical protein [Sphingobium jiangsuense]GLS99640.1 hypothetical protein GCM10007897_10220 [Sphingobium jiangsuense]
MQVTVNVDCTPEEARSFLGLPDLSPVHEKYVASLLGAMDGAGSLEQMEKMMRAFAPMGDAGMRLFQQMMDIGLSGAAAATGGKGKG